MARESLTRQDLIDKLQVQKGIAELPGWCDWTAEQAKAHMNTHVMDIVSTKEVLSQMAEMLILLRDGTNLRDMHKVEKVKKIHG